MARKSRFKKTVFSNGLTLLTERHSEYRSLAIGAWVNVGTRHEVGSDIGVSHFLEHMLFKGTEKRSALDIAREVDRVGGDINAFTGREQTCFHLTLLDRDLALGIEILSDLILNSTFDREELERERKVILQEIAMVDENPEELAHDIFFEKLYPDHGLGMPILGTTKTIRRMSRRGVMDYFRKNYTPDQVVIAVAGNVSHEAVARHLRPLIRSKWPGRPLRRKRPRFPHAPPLTVGNWWVPRETEQVHLLWGVKGPTHSSKDRFAAHLLNVLLGGGMSSTLFQEIREKNGLAYSVYSSLTPFTDSGVFSIYAATGPAQAPLCLRLISECVEGVKKTTLSESELRVIQDNLKGTILLSADSAESMMTHIASNDFALGRNMDLDEICSCIDAVRPEDLRRLAHKLFREEKRSLLAFGPRPAPTFRRKFRFEYI